MKVFTETLAALSPLRGKQSKREGPQSTPQQEYGEEVLVVDARAQLTPSQMVEHKLIGLMKTVPVSFVHSATRLRGR